MRDANKAEDKPQKASNMDPPQQNQSDAKTTGDKPPKAYYLVEKECVSKEKTENSPPTKSLICYMFISNDQEEGTDIKKDEKESNTLYMVQWKQEAGCSPCKRDQCFDFFIGKRKELADTKKSDDKDNVNNFSESKIRKKKKKKKKKKKGTDEKQIQEVKDDGHVVYYLKPTNMPENEILSLIKDDNNRVYHMKKKKNIDTKGRGNKVDDGESSFLLMVTKEPITNIQNQGQDISKNFISNQSRAYEMVEMSGTDHQREEILLSIKYTLRSIWERMKETIQVMWECIYPVVKNVAAKIGFQKEDVTTNFLILIFAVLVILVMVGDAVLIFLGKDDKKSCDIGVALQLLNFTVLCKDDDVTKRLGDIFITSIFALLFDGIWLTSGLALKCSVTSQRQKRTVFAAYVVSFVLLALIFGGLFLDTEEKIEVSKTQQTSLNYTEIKIDMKDSLGQYTSDVIDNRDTMSNRWNKFFIKYDCCAVNQVFSTTNDFDTTPWCTTSGSCQLTNSQIPKTCCRDVTEDDYNNAASSCHATVTAGTYKDSCFSQIKKLGDMIMTEDYVDHISIALFTTGILKTTSAMSLMFFCVCFIILEKCCVKKRSNKDAYSLLEDETVSEA